MLENTVDTSLLQLSALSPFKTLSTNTDNMMSVNGKTFPNFHFQAWNKAQILNTQPRDQKQPAKGSHLTCGMNLHLRY